jgi:hypothetical protein
MRSLLLPCAATGVSLLAMWCLLGATPRGQPWTTAVTLSQGRDGRRRCRWRCCGRFVRPRCVATCAVTYCATRGSIAPLLYPQLIATKEFTRLPRINTADSFG